MVKVICERPPSPKAMYEILNNIKIIKLNAWEESFQSKIEKIRNDVFELISYKDYEGNVNIGLK